MRKLLTILRSLFPLIGAVCILCPERVTAALPYLLGGTMAAYGIIHIAVCVRTEGLMGTSSDQLAQGLVLSILGGTFLAQGADSLGPMGTTWAIIGIRKASRSLGGAIQRMQRGESFLSPLLLFFLRIVLTMLLLFDPSEKFSPHIVILGWELIAVCIRSTVRSPAVAED